MEGLADLHEDFGFIVSHAGSLWMALCRGMTYQTSACFMDLPDRVWRMGRQSGSRKAS